MTLVALEGQAGVGLLHSDAAAGDVGEAGGLRHHDVVQDLQHPVYETPVPPFSDRSTPTAGQCTPICTCSSGRISWDLADSPPPLPPS